MSRVTNITSLDQLNALAKRGVTVVDFSAVWCGPCKAISPKYDEFSNAYKTVNFAKVDIEAAEDVTALYNITAVPTFVFLENNKEIARVQGANIAAVKANLDKLTSTSF